VIVMIFEFWIRPDQAVLADYTAMSSDLRILLAHIDGFRGVERFESSSEPGRFVAIGFFDDEDAVTRWRNDPLHRHAQRLGRSRFFSDYRLRMAHVVRDYGPNSRRTAPADSNQLQEGT